MYLVQLFLSCQINSKETQSTFFKIIIATAQKISDLNDQHKAEKAKLMDNFKVTLVKKEEVSEIILLPDLHVTLYLYATVS